MQSEKLNSCPYSLYSFERQEVASFYLYTIWNPFYEMLGVTMVAVWLNYSLGRTGIYTQKYVVTESLCIFFSKQHYPQ